MCRYLYSSVWLMILSLCFCSMNTIEAQARFCGNHQLHQQLMATDADYAARYESGKTTIAKATRKLWDSQTTMEKDEEVTVLTIPVVLHIVHHPTNSVGEGSNIAVSQIEAGMEQLNNAFRNVGFYDPSSGVDVEIEFCLASKDPNGFDTNGINRIPSFTYDVIDMAIEEPALKDNTARWDPNRYMNIWIVDEICDFSLTTNPCDVAAYAYLATEHGLGHDGVVTEDAFFGADQDETKILVHEIGHYLNLYHPFYQGCKNDDCLTDGDFVCDTPPDASLLFTSCASSNNSCTTDIDDNSPNNPFRATFLGGLGDQNDMIENYMDYGHRSCQSIFTPGQKERMQLSLSTLRASLLDSDGCGSSFSRDIGISEVVTPGSFACDNPSELIVTVANFGNAAIHSFVVNYGIAGSSTQTFNWTGTLLSGESINVLIDDDFSFSTGTHTLIAYTSNPNGSFDQASANDGVTTSFHYVGVQSLPFTEDFESVNISDSWLIINPDNSKTWEIKNVAGCDDNGLRSIYLNNYNYSTGIGQGDFLYSRFDFSAQSIVELNFDLSYIPYNASFSDRLKVVISTDCGATYTELYNKSGVEMAAITGFLTSSWSPGSCFHWRTETLDLSAYAGQEVLLGFVNLCRYGNNLYIDNIDINGDNVVIEPIDCQAPNTILTTSATSNSVNVLWLPAADASHYNVRYRPTGSGTWTPINSVTSPISLDGILTPGTAYEVQVQTVCTDGSLSEFSNSKTFTTNDVPCNPPTTVNVINISDNSATITWSAIAAADTYLVNYRPVGGSWLVESSVATFITIHDLSPGITYEVRLQSSCDDNFSNNSAPKFFTTDVLCEIPFGLVVLDVSHNNAIIEWVDLAEVSSYQFEYRMLGSSIWTTLYPTGHLSIVTGLAANTNYECRVKAICEGVESTYSDLLSFSTTAFCLTPTDLQVSTVTDDSAILNWSSSADATGYNIQYKPKDDELWLTTFAVSTPKILSGLQIGTIYEFRVESVCSGATSGYSSSEIFSTLTICDIPTGLAVFPVSETSVNVVWNEVTTATSTELAFRSIWPIEADWVYIPSFSNSSIISGLNSGTTYETKVRSVCLDALATHSPYSPTVTFTTPGGCNVADGLTLTAISYTSATLQWNSMDDATEYHVRYKKITGTSWTTVTVSNNFLTINDLLPTSTYQYQVQTVCGVAVTAYSNSLNFTTQTLSCDIPINLQSVEMAGEGTLLTWVGTDEAVNYEVRYREMGSDDWDSINTNATSLMLAHLSDCGNFEFQVRADCNLTVTPFSNSQLFVVTLCTDYCEGYSTNSNFDWIGEFSFGNFENNSGNNGGYGDFTDMVITAQRGQIYELVATAHFANKSLREYWKVWIDFNQNGTFESFEEVFKAGEPLFGIFFSLSPTVDGEITIPPGAPLGNTRMRIVMHYNEYAEACEIFSFGEVEDYTIQIVE